MLANPGLSKAEPLWGSFILMKNALFEPPLPFEKMKLKKRYTDGVEKGISNDDISFSL